MTLGNVERYTYTMSGDTYIGITKTGMKANVLGDLPCKYDNCTIKKRKFGAFYFNSEAIFNGKVSFTALSTKFIIDTTKENKSVSIGGTSFTFKNDVTTNPNASLINWTATSSSILKTITYPKTGDTKITIKIYDTQILISGLNSPNINVQIDGASNTVNTKKIVCGVDITYTENDITYDYEGFLIKDVIIINDTDLSLYDFIQKFKIKATSTLARSNYEFSSSSAQIIKRNTSVDRYEVRLAELKSSDKSENDKTVNRFRSYYMLDDIVTTMNSVFVYDDYVFYIYSKSDNTPVQYNNSNIQFYPKNISVPYYSSYVTGYKTKIFNKNTSKTLEGITIIGDKLIFEIGEYASLIGYQDLLPIETFTLSQQRINFNNASNDDKYYYLGFYVKNLKDHIDNNRTCRNGTITRGASQSLQGKKFTVDGTDITDLYTGTVLYNGILYNVIIIGNIIIINTIAEKIIDALTDIGDCNVKFQSYKWSTQTTVNVSSAVNFAPRSVYGMDTTDNTYKNTLVGAATKTYCIDGMRNMDLFNIRNISTDNFSVFVGSCEYTNYLMRDCVTDSIPTASTMTDVGSEALEVARGLFLDYDDGEVTSCVIAGNYIFRDEQYAQLSKIITQCRNKNPLIAVNRTVYNSQNPSDYRCDCWIPLDPSKALTWGNVPEPSYMINTTMMPDDKYYVMVINVLKNNIGRKTIIYHNHIIYFKFLIGSTIHEITVDNNTNYYLNIRYKETSDSTDWKYLTQTDYTIESIKQINYSGTVKYDTVSSGPGSSMTYNAYVSSYDTHIITISITDNDYICVVFNCKSVKTTAILEYNIPNLNKKLIFSGTTVSLSPSGNFKFIHGLSFVKPTSHI